MILLFYVTQNNNQYLIRKIMSFVNICDVLGIDSDVCNSIEFDSEMDDCINFEKSHITNQLNFEVMFQLEENLIG